MEWQRHKTRAEMEHLTHHIYNSMEMDIHRDHSLSIGKKNIDHNVGNDEVDDARNATRSLRTSSFVKKGRGIIRGTHG
jgi:hypothetical protein